jgi:polar amino acid transport system substrate-binding protein
MTKTIKAAGGTICLLLSLLHGQMALAAGPDWAEITIATEGAYPPFNFLDTAGQLHGLDVDVAKALCAEMKAKCTFVAQDWDGIIPGLKAGKFDAIIASMSITPEREKEISFSDKYYTSRLSVLARAETTLTDISPANFKGKTIGAQSSTPQADYIADVYGKLGADVKLYPTQDEANMDLQNGRLDAVVADKFYLASFLKSSGANCCKLIGDLGEGQTDIAVGLRHEDGALKDKINTALKTILANGTYKTIITKYFDFDIY